MKQKPAFLTYKGCINCPGYQQWQKRDLGGNTQLHEVMLRCVLLGCESYGHDLLRPFFHPDEVDREVVKRGNISQEVARAKQHRQATEKFERQFEPASPGQKGEG